MGLGLERGGDCPSCGRGRVFDHLIDGMVTGRPRLECNECGAVFDKGPSPATPHIARAKELIEQAKTTKQAKETDG